MTEHPRRWRCSTQWNEATGPTVDEFWRLVGELGLPYVRRDLLREILSAGRIPSREHYEFMQDNLIVLEQENRISPEQAETLSAMVWKVRDPISLASRGSSS